MLRARQPTRPAATAAPVPVPAVAPIDAAADARDSLLAAVRRGLQRASQSYARSKRAAQDDFMRLQRFADDTQHARATQELATILSHAGTATSLRQVVASALAAATCADARSGSHHAQASAGPRISLLPESLDYVWRARVEWERRLRFEMRAVARKQARALVQRRAPLSGDDSGRSSGGIHVPAPAAAEFQVRFVYTAEDLLEILCAIRNPNQMPSHGASPISAAPSAATPASPPGCGSWGLIQLELPVLSMPLLVAKYAALSPSHRQVGVDDTVLGSDWFVSERQRAGEDLLAATTATPAAASSAATAAALRHFAKTGLPPSLRPAFWSRMAGISLPLSSSKVRHYDSLLANVNTWSLLTDDLLQFDVADGPGDDDEYFVFHEQLEELMLAFSRDAEVTTLTSLLANAAPLLAKPSQQLAAQMGTLNDIRAASAAKSSSSAGSDFASQLPDSVPPNRLVPFHRLVYFATPLCFLYAQMSEAYFVFRALYSRLFCRLSIVSSAPSGILSLCRCFETLLAARAPHLFYKCLSLGVQPLQCSFSWLFSAFSGWLAVDQLLLLWDRLLAFDSLELVAILAAAIFLWREQSIMRATTKAELQECMRELANIKVVPLLQLFLFSNAPTNS